MSIGIYPAELNGSPPIPRDTTNDVANAERFAEQHGRHLRYVHNWGSWLRFDGVRWKADDNGVVMRYAKSTASTIYAEAAVCGSEGLQKSLANWAKLSHSRARLEAMVELAKSERPLPITHDKLDADPWQLNTTNGTIDLRSSELRKHDSADLITKTCGVIYPTGPGSEPELWLDFLDQIFGGDTELISFTQRLIGSALPGVVMEHRLPILLGTGSNGKSVFTETILAMLGDYSFKAPAGLLMASRGERHPCELADLYGKRLVAITETGEGQRLNEPLVKELTGGDTIRARRMRENFWQFTPSHQVVLTTNHRPVVRGTDHGIWRRLLLIPFEVTIAADKQDNQLQHKLRGELGAILRWAVHGCIAWQRGGLNPPARVVAATEEYRVESDTFARWFDERCVVADHAVCKAGEGFDDYVAWCERSHERYLTQTAFGRRLADKPFTKTRGRDGFVYAGFGLISESVNGVNSVNPFPG